MSQGPPRVIAIDGPSGSGKSTVARGVAARLGLEVLDTGAMYRSVTLAALEAGIDLADGAVLAELAARLAITVGGTVRIDGRDVTAEIRGPSVTSAVSTVAAHPEVRAVLVERQRAWVAERGGGVVEGRDIGTVVFPDAPVKVFLTASDEERARRRHRDETAARRRAEVTRVAEELAERDRLDSSRAVSPLAVASDARVLDTTDRTVDEVVDEIVAMAHAAFGDPRGAG